MPFKTLALIVVACALGGCFLERTPRQKFLELLRQFEKSRPKTPDAELSPEQQKRRERLIELKKKDALAFQRAAQAMEGLESAEWKHRRMALLTLAECGETGAELLRFRAGFFDAHAPSDFDALLLKCDDSAVFHLRKDLIEKLGDERARAKRALDLLLPLKTKLLLEWLATSGEKVPNPAYYEILAARNRALPALSWAIESRNSYLASIALKAASDIGTPEAASFLARLAPPGSIGPKSEDVLEALGRMDADVSFPAVEALVGAGTLPDPLEAAWFLAERALPAFGEKVKLLAESEDPEVRIAGLCGQLRLGRAEAVSAIRELALGKDAPVDPLRFLRFLRAFPFLASPFEADLVLMSGSTKKEIRVTVADLLGFGSGAESEGALLAVLDDADPEVRLIALGAAGRRLRSGPNEALLEAVSKRAGDEEGTVRRRALAVLGSSRARAAVPVLMAAIETGDAAEKVAALDGLSLFRDPGLWMRVPLEIYYGRDAEARRALVRGLAMASDPSARQAVHALLRQGDVSSRLIGLSLLDRETAKALEKDLLRILSSTNPQLKEAGLRAICTVDASRLFDDPDLYIKAKERGVRLTAIRLLGRRKDFTARLLSLSESLDPGVRRAALEALAAAPPPEARLRFEASVFEGSADLRLLGVGALAVVGTADSLPFVEFASRDPDRRVRSASARTLAALRGEEAGDTLTRLQADPDPMVALSGAAALEKIGAPSEAPSFRKAARAGSTGLSPRERGGLLVTLRDFEGAASCFAEGASLADVPFEPWLEAARAWARAGRADRALAMLARARDAGFDAFSGLEEEEGFRLLFEIHGFPARLRDLFRPAREGPGFLDRFRGRVKVYLQNGRSLKGELLGFRDERFILRLPSGEMELPKLQVERLEFLEED